jgi:Domain of unknown function (DUF4252)
MKKTTGMFLIFLMLAASNAFPQEKTDYSKYPGYVDFGNISKYMTGDNVKEVNLDSNLLNMLSKMGGEKDTSFKSVIGGLKLIRVNSFGVNASNENEVKDVIASVDKSLMSKNWERIVKVKENGEYTNVYVLPSSDYENFLGLCVTSIDAKKKIDKGGAEATFVNIVGNINMSQLGKLGDKFNFPSMNKMMKEKKDKEKSENN